MPSPDLHPPEPVDASGVRRRDLAILCGVVVLLMSAVSIANLSAPVLATSPLHASTIEQTWFVDAFVIAFACLLLPAEMLGVRFGEERVLVAGLALFAVSGLVALVAPTMAALIVSRGLAGIGAGIALPQTLSILLHRSSGRGHARVVATWTAATSIAGIVGNGLGGALISAGGWRIPFAVTLPATVLALVLVLAVVRVRRATDPSTAVDVKGMAFFVLAAVAALVTIIEALNLLGRPWVSAILLAVVLFAAWGFVRAEKRAAAPVLHPTAMRAAVVHASAIGIIATFLVLFMLFSLNAHLVQSVRGLSAAYAGLALVPVSVAMLVVTYATVPLMRRLGMTVVVVSGLAVSAAGFGLAALTIEGTMLEYEVSLVVIGIGAGLCSSPLSTRLTAVYAVIAGRAGAGVNSTLRELASALGVATAGVALAVTAATRGDGHVLAEDTIVVAARAVFGGAAVGLVVCAVVLGIVMARATRPIGR